MAESFSRFELRHQPADKVQEKVLRPSMVQFADGLIAGVVVQMENMPRAGMNYKRMWIR